MVGVDGQEAAAKAQTNQGNVDFLHIETSIF
jgi:hypothetical protein